MLGGQVVPLRKKKKKKRQGAATYGRYEVGGGGGHSGLGGGRGIPECFSEEGPHHSVAGEKQPATQQPQRDMKLENKNRTLACITVKFVNFRVYPLSLD